MTSLPTAEASSSDLAPASDASEEERWDLIITARPSWFSFHLRDLWRYRDLLVLLLRRDFRTTYAHTLLGPLWFVLDPVGKALVFTVVFGKIASIPTGGIPDFVFYLSGITIWGLFAACVNTNNDFLVANLDVFGKVYFPRLVVPVAQTLANLALFIVPLALFAVIAAFFALRGSAIEVTWALALLPVIVLVTATLGSGLALLVASLTVKYRDLSVLVSFAIGALMFISPVIVPLAEVGGGIRTFMELNPMTPMIEWFRYGALGSGTATAGGFAYSAVFALVLLVAGLIGVSRVERTFVDIA